MTIDNLFDLPVWPLFLGQPTVEGNLRQSIEDFQVEEIPALIPSGDGSHLWLHVQKRDCNTVWVGEQLALQAGCAARDVGYAGMKDRQAVTSQWFSLPAPVNAELPWKDWVIPNVVILTADRHQKKLQRGALKGNQFNIVVRDLTGDLESIESSLEKIKARGVPNYFGPQRFGHGGSNVRRGVQFLFKGGRLPRAKRSIYLSAVRSFLFNQVLAERVEQGNWDSLLEGDVLMLDGTHSVFLAALSDQDLVKRCLEFDVHPTGPLPGDGGFLPERDAALLEQEILEPYQELVEPLKNARLRADRRSLRLRVKNLQWEISNDSLNLRFVLPPGAYATTVVNELVSTV